MSEQELVTTQPAATAEPTIESEVPATAVQDYAIAATTIAKSATEALPLVTVGFQQNEAPQRRYRRPSGFRHGFFKFLRVVNKIFSGLLRVFLIIIGVIGVAILFVFMTALSFGSVAANGAVIMLIGNGILRAAHLSHYTTNKIAAEIGAVGCLVATGVIGFALNCILPSNAQEEKKPSSWITFIATVVVGTLSGTLGTAILKHRHVDLKGMDVLHATRAGALGGAILGPGSIFLLPVVFLAIGVILSPLWIAMVCGVEWIYTKSSESWTDNSHSYSICYCVGTCGDDPEINAEMDHINAIQRRHRDFGHANNFF